MAEVVLFNPKRSEHSIGGPSIPWGLLYLSSGLVDEGYNVRIIDEFITPNWEEMLLSEIKTSPLFFGVSSMTGKQIEYGLKFSSFVKKKCSAPVVWGGIHPTLFPEQTLKNQNIDFVVKGEGEESIVELARALEQNKSAGKIRGVCYKEKKRIFMNQNRKPINLNSIKRIPFELIDAEFYVKKEFGSERAFELCTSRGCPHNCKFCYNLAICGGNVWRSLDIGKIIENLNFIINKYKIDGVNWREDNFFVSKKRVKEIAERIITEKIDIKWHADCRIDYFYGFDHELISLIKSAGCHTLTFGVESGSGKILQYINKGITREQALKVKEKAIKNGIYQNYHFMMGFPPETEKDRNETISLIYELIKNNKYLEKIYGPAIFTPYPGTELYGEALSSGFIAPNSLDGWATMDWENVSTPWLQPKEKKAIENIAWNLKGMGGGNNLLRSYFAFKIFLLEKLKLNLPCFEKSIFLFFQKLKYSGNKTNS